MGVAQHVDQRTLADDGAEQIGPLHHGRGDQQAAIRRADDADSSRGDAARFEIGGDSLEIVEGALAVGLQSRLVPGRAELAAAADIGDRDRAALCDSHSRRHRADDGRRSSTRASAKARSRHRNRGWSAPGHSCLWHGSGNRGSSFRPRTSPRIARLTMPLASKRAGSALIARRLAVGRHRHRASAASGNSR